MGADIVYGEIGHKMTQPGFETGYWQGPVVLEGIPFESDMFRHEFYGPIFCLYRVNSGQEAIEYANNSDHGKSATVFSESPLYCKTIALNLRVGSVHINRAVYSSTEFPAGGIKNSGSGSSSYSDGLLNLSNRKSIVNKCW